MTENARNFSRLIAAMPPEHVFSMRYDPPNVIGYYLDLVGAVAPADIDAAVQRMGYDLPRPGIKTYGERRILNGPESV
jgi:hypothetical protein